MAWLNADIKIAGAMDKCSINKNEVDSRIEIPFKKEYLEVESLELDGSTIAVKSITNVGDRDEILLMEIENDKPKKRGNKDKPS
jgi:hypothetical protein|tara:strand:- start:3105 stop:3356 length:252 start_codon:yes stop_codon:yes gene_type:complete